MQEVEAICDRVIIIDKGKIVADEPKENIYSIIKHPHQVVHVGFDKEISEQDLHNILNVVKVQQIKNRSLAH